MSNKKFQLTNLATGKSCELDTLSGSVGPDVVNIAPLYKEHGVFTFDPGFMATASCESHITYIDGDAGVLLYRGYPIEQLAQHSSHLEVAYLLMYGELPNAAQFKSFHKSIRRHTMLNESLLMKLRREGCKVGLFRPVSLFPFPQEELFSLGGRKRRFLVIEMNAGQMVEDVQLALHGSSPVFFYGRPGGAMITPEDIEKEIIQVLNYPHPGVWSSLQRSEV